jgi:hypothetical protein
MGKYIMYNTGDIMGNNIIYLNDIKRVRRQYRRALFKCHCGNTFESDISHIRSLNIKSCGCLNTSEVKRKRETKHGLYGHILYKRWISMNERCYRLKDSNYYKYGGRGIKVFDDWHKNFISFYNYIIKLENYNEDLLKSNKLSIDRIDNNKNYEPNNIRITNWHIQSTNKRIQHNNTTGYKGIQLNKKLNKWISIITVNKKRYYLGLYLNKEDAIQARLNFINKNKLNEYI